MKKLSQVDTRMQEQLAAEITPRSRYRGVYDGFHVAIQQIAVVGVTDARKLGSVSAIACELDIPFEAVFSLETADRAQRAVRGLEGMRYVLLDSCVNPRENTPMLEQLNTIPNVLNIIAFKEQD